MVSYCYTSRNYYSSVSGVWLFKISFLNIRRIALIIKRPNLKLKTPVKQLLGYLPLAFYLPIFSQSSVKPEELLSLELYTLNGITSPKYKLLYFLTTIFCKEKKALTLNQDRYCHLALCLWLILFYTLCCFLHPISSSSGWTQPPDIG